MKQAAAKRRVAIFASGRGSNAGALIAAAEAPDYPAEITLVLCNQPAAPVLRDARAAGVVAMTLDHRAFGGGREEHEHAMQTALLEHGIELVCLAGYMRLLTPWLVDQWTGRMLNIHPSLLPAFPGLHTHARALAAGVRVHGCTVHQVTRVMDDGPILAQAAVPVLPGDTAETLAARVLRQEHVLYPATLAAFARGERGVAADADAVLMNPVT